MLKYIIDLVAKDSYAKGWKCLNIIELYFYLLGVVYCLGVRGDFSLQEMPAQFAVTNRRNKGLISVDRKTSLLSYLQYPVPYQSRLQRIYRSQCPKGD